MTSAEPTTEKRTSLGEKDTMGSLSDRPTSSPAEHGDTGTPHSHEGSEKEVDENLKEQKPDPADDDIYPKSFRLGAIVIALVLSIFLVSLDMTIVATAIPRITDQFHSLDQVGWYGSAFFLTLASFQSMWGKAYKYFPVKTTFLISIVIFEVGSLICAVANNSTTLIVGRAIAGMGGAGIASGVYTIMAFTAPPKQRPAFTGLLGATYGCASVIGPLLGGVFTDKLSWRWCFYINLPVGGASIVIIVLIFQTPKVVKPVEATLKEKILQMDLLGCFTILAAVICYLLALQWGGVTKAWSDRDVVGTLVGFGLLVIAFIGVEIWMGERALLQGRLFRRVIIVGCLYVAFLGGVFFVLLYYLPLYFQAVSGVSPSQSGIRNIPLVVGCSIFTIISGGLITVYGHYVPIMIVSSIISTIGAGLIYTLDIGSPPSHWIGYQALVGIGLGLGFQIPIIVAQASVEPEDISAVTAFVLFFQIIGGSFFVSAGQAAFANTLLTKIQQNLPSVSPALVVATGATDLRNVFKASDIPIIVAAYLDGLHIAYILGIAVGGISLFIAVFMPFKKIDATKAMGG